MAKFLEDIYGKYFWTDTPEEWDAVFEAAKDAGVPMTGEVAIWRCYRELLLRQTDFWVGNPIKRNDPYYITTQDVLEVLRLEKLCKEKPGLKEAIKKAGELGIRPGVEVRWTNGTSDSGPFTVPSYGKWEDNGSGWYWPKKTGAPSSYCWIVSNGDPRRNAKPTGNSYVTLSGTSCVATVVSVEDNEIRVGDTVERVKESHYGMVVGDRATVTSVSLGTISLLEYGGVGVYHDKENFKKVTNAGGRSSTTNNNQAHGQVHRESEGEGIGCGEGQAIRAGGSKSRIAVGFQPAGDPLKARTGKGRIAVAQILHEPVSAGHL